MVVWDAITFLRCSLKESGYATPVRGADGEYYFFQAVFRRRFGIHLNHYLPQK